MTSTSAVLCLAPNVEDHLLPQLPAAGLLVVARPPGTTEAAEAVSRLRPGVLIATAEPRHLDAALVHAAAAAGATIVALAAGERDRVHAAALGLREALDALAEVGAQALSGSAAGRV